MCLFFQISPVTADIFPELTKIHEVGTMNSLLGDPATQESLAHMIASLNIHRGSTIDQIEELAEGAFKTNVSVFVIGSVCVLVGSICVIACCVKHCKKFVLADNEQELQMHGGVNGGINVVV